MPLRHLDPGARVGADRDDVVVVIPLYGAHDLFVRCLRSVLTHTPAGVVVLIADDADPDDANLRHVTEVDAAGGLAGRDVVWSRRPVNEGFVGNCNAAFASCAPADVLLLNSDVEVAEGWLEGLREAARSDTTIATATALANDASILSVPYRNAPVPNLPQHLTLAEAAAAVRQGSQRLRPRLPTAIGHCVYVRRAALELVGSFSEAFAPAYGEEVDFSQRCVLHGLQHVAADDVLVLHHGRGSLGVEGTATRRNPIQDEHERLIAERYPHYHPWVQQVEADEHGPLARALYVASRAVLGRSVTIDGRCLSGPMVGTQVLALELIRALHRTGEVRLRVLLPESAGQEALELLRELDVALVSPGEVDDAYRDAVVHRPFQVVAPTELKALVALGRRFVLTHLDLIAFRNPGYFPAAAPWLAYRELTREVMALADKVVFISDHAMRDALSEGLLPVERAEAVPIGTDHDTLRAAPREPAAFRGEDPATRRPFLLCLGTDFRHKNRRFALELLEALVEEHDWDGEVVLAGARVARGASSGDEAAWLSLHPRLEGRVRILPATDDAERAWLYTEAAAVVYPSTYEGFGFVPFEAADAGTPCFFAAQSSLTDTLATATAVLEPWDPHTSAARAIAALREPARAAELVAEVRAAASTLTWDATARRMLEVYDEALSSRNRDVTLLAGERLAVDSRYWTLRDQIGDTGMALVGPDGGLLPADVQNVLAGLARRPATRKVLLGSLGAMKRVASGRTAGDDHPLP